VNYASVVLGLHWGAYEVACCLHRLGYNMEAVGYSETSVNL